MNLSISGCLVIDEPLIVRAGADELLIMRAGVMGSTSGREELTRPRARANDHLFERGIPPG